MAFFRPGTKIASRSRPAIDSRRFDLFIAELPSIIEDDSAVQALKKDFVILLAAPAPVNTPIEIHLRIAVAARV
jgi:hypothetical protein